MIYLLGQVFPNLDEEVEVKYLGNSLWEMFINLILVNKLALLSTQTKKQKWGFRPILFQSRAAESYPQTRIALAIIPNLTGKVQLLNGGLVRQTCT